MDISLKCSADFFAKVFKNGVFGENYAAEEAEAAAAKERGSAATQKRKAAADLAATEAQEYNWGQLADTGKVRVMPSLQILGLLYTQPSLIAHSVYPVYPKNLSYYAQI